MPFGILDCNKLEVVPGTALLGDQDDIPAELRAVGAQNLKHGAGKFSHVS